MKLAKKYLITVIAFVVIIGFLDTNSVWNRLEIRKVNDSLRHEIQVYKERSQRDSLRLDELRATAKPEEILKRIYILLIAVALAVLRRLDVHHTMHRFLGSIREIRVFSGHSIVAR